MRYRWQTCPNPACLILHVDVRLPHWDTLGDLGCDQEDLDFAHELSYLPGMDSVMLGRAAGGYYRAMFVRGDLFDWKEIKPEILRVFKERYCPRGQIVEVPGEAMTTPTDPAGCRQ